MANGPDYHKKWWQLKAERNNPKVNPVEDELTVGLSSESKAFGELYTSETVPANYYTVSDSFTWIGTVNPISAGQTYTDLSGDELEPTESIETAPKRIIPVSEVVLVKGKSFTEKQIEHLKETLNAHVYVVDDLSSISMLDLDELQEMINEERAKNARTN